jgi:hypothetical protein
LWNDVKVHFVLDHPLRSADADKIHAAKTYRGSGRQGDLALGLWISGGRLFARGNVMNFLEIRLSSWFGPIGLAHWYSQF